MSVLNRKMFRSRNARNALNRSAGIPAVASFHAGGPVGHTHRTFPGPRTGPGPVILNKQLPTMTPNVASGVATALRPDQLRRLGQERMRTSLFGQRPSQSLKLSGGISGVMNQGVPVTELDKLTQKAKVGAGQALDVGMSALQAPINVGFDMGTNLAEKGTQLTPEFGQQVISGQAQLSKQQLAGINAGLIKLPNNLVQALESGELPLIPGLDMTRVDPNLDPGARIMKELPGEQTFKMGRPGDAPKETPEQRMARIATEDAGMETDDDSIQNLLKASRILSDESRMQQGQVPADGDVLVETESFDIDTDDQDPVRPKSTADPEEPGPEDPAAAADRDEADNKTAAIVAQARTANAAEGIPPQDSAQSEITTAIESGTDSPAAIKAEFMKLLPKYEEDSSVTQGLNLALMGFTIASGTSSNALENFANGMRKTIPNFIKSAEKRKAFERETDLLASKYTIQRLEGDRTRGFAKNDYYVTKDFEGPNGTKYTAGQYLRLNDKGFSALERGGFTRNLVSGTIYKQLLDDRAEVTKARLAKTPKTIDDFYQSTPKTVKINENISLEIYMPKVSAPKGNGPRLAGREQEWNAVTQGYVNDLAAIAETDNALEDAIKLVQGGGLGTPGLVGKLADAAKGATENTPMQPFLAKAGLDYSKLSTANQLENLNRIIALQSARIILNEGGKMISNQERQMVARSLGFKDATIEPGTDTLNLGSYSNVFTSEDSAVDALRKVQKIVRSKARDSHSGYKEAANMLGFDLQTLQGAKKAAPGPRLQKRDDGKFYFGG